MFRPELATATACYFLERAPNQTLNDLVLMKLMVIAERLFMKETTSLLMGAQFKSMQNGPVLSEVLNLMKGTLPSPLWQSHIHFLPWQGHGTSSNRCVLAKPFPVEDFLSDYEIGKLEEVSRDYEHKSKWEIVDVTHTFPEWDSTCAVTKSSRPITLEEIYRLSLDESEETAKARADEIAYFEAVSA